MSLGDSQIITDDMSREADIGSGECLRLLLNQPIIHWEILRGKVMSLLSFHFKVYF